jgi:hypothetical protein
MEGANMNTVQMGGAGAGGDPGRGRGRGDRGGHRHGWRIDKVGFFL